VGSDATQQGHTTEGAGGAGGGLRSLAQERFGSLLTGDPPDVTSGEPGGGDEDEERAAAARQTGDEAEDAGLGEGDDASAADEAEGEDAATAAEDGDEEQSTEETGTFRSLDELFQAAELEPDKAGDLKVRVKVDGRESEVPLSDVVASYQMRSAAEQRLSEARDKAKALDQELTAKRTAAEENLNQAAKLVETLEGKLEEETRGIDWATLRKEDPDEYAAKKVEISERRAEIEKLKSEAVNTYRQAMEQREQEARKQHEERLAQEHAALLEHLPEWRDEAKARDEKGRLVQYLKDQGFAPQDVQGVADHRLILLARKAMLYDQGRKGAAQKKAAKPGRVLRPGTPPSREQQNQDRSRRALAEHRKSGTVKSAMEVLRAKRGAGSHGAAHRNVRHQ